MQHQDVRILNSLITTTIDSVRGFRRSAENAESPNFKKLFTHFAEQRAQIVGRLQQRVRELGGTPEDDGSFKAALHRGWEDLRTALSAHDDQAVIAEVERGEDYIKEKYERALADSDVSAESLALVRACYQNVREGHDRASQLKHGLAHGQSFDDAFGQMDWSRRMEDSERGQSPPPGSRTGSTPPPPLV